MKCPSILLSLATTSAVQGAAFNGPTPTATNLDRVLADTLPAPTVPPSNAELKKRQTNLNPDTCGWVNGIYSLGVTCPSSLTCMLYTTSSSGMAGCCDGTDTINCGWASSCIDARAYASSACDSDCLADSFIRKCTASTAPYCVTWSYPSNDIYDYGCAGNSDSSVSTVFQAATDAFGVTTSMALPTVAAEAVGTDVSTHKTAKKLAIGIIVGIVIVVLFVLFCVAIGVLFCVKKKRKARQIAASSAAMSAVQTTRPQRQYSAPAQSQQAYPYSPPPQHQHQHHQSPIHPVHEEKPIPTALVHEYTTPSISSPSSPVPVYTQPHGVPHSVPVVSRYEAPAAVHEVDAVSVARGSGAGGGGLVCEMGGGK